MLHISIKQLKTLLIITLVVAGLVLSNCSFINYDSGNLNLENESESYRTETFVNDVKVVIHADVPVSAKSVEENKIVQIIENYFIDTNPDKYSRIIVQVDYNNYYNPESLMVYLLDKDSTSFDAAKVSLGDRYSVIFLEQGKDTIYEDAETSSNTTNTSLTGDSNNPGSRSLDFDNVQFVFSTCEDDLQTAVAAVNRAYDIAIAKGYNVVKLIGEEENKANIKALLNSPDLIGWGRVGHGVEVGIVLDDGALYYRYFDSLPAATLNNKVIFFASCKVHNPPLLTSIIDAGVQKFIGGTRQLAIGPAEEVFKNFWDQVITNESPITDSLNSAQLKYYFSSTAFGVSGQEEEYLITGE